MPRLASSGSRSKYWCGTWNHAGDKEGKINDSINQLNCSCWFDKLYASKERGASGTLHLQIYCHTKTRKYESEMRYQFPGVHWETRKGNEEQARNYALGKNKHGDTKAGWIEVVIDHGEHKAVGQGSRTDLERIRDMLTSAEVTTVRELMDEVTSMPSLAFGKEWLACHPPPARAHPPKVFWLYGSTGTGKTRAVHDFSSKTGLTLWRMPASGNYFQGYIGQDIALFDDFRAGRLPFTELLELTDRYAPVANVKYGQCWFVPTWIFFTSAKSLADTFKHEDECIDQFTRRITEGGGAELNFDSDGLVTLLGRIDVFIASMAASDSVGDEGQAETKDDDANP